ncbi:MAG: 50S ribosomal protein L5 [Patescibacteria group bacterium]|nr:50S ribosomal protein L5 [Patescibacteria group bacterium]
MLSLQQKENKDVRPKLAAQFKYGNLNMTPKLIKIVLNVGLRSDLKDARVVDEYTRDLAAISGQKPVSTVAKKSISSFKIREGQTVGLMVTLRGKRMYEFLDKLINVTLPRVRDFRGLEEKGFDRSGNYSLGFRDQLAFPEISAESVDHLFGIQVTLTVSARTREAGIVYLRALGLPLKSVSK